MKAHIYSLFDNKNQKVCYVGQTNGNEPTYRTGSKILRRYISIFGCKAFDNRFCKNIIEYCTIQYLDEKEEYWIEHYDTFNNGLNLTKGGRYDWKRNNLKPVMQYNLEGNFIKEWECGKWASLELNIQFDGISSCCLGKQRTAGGYIWRFKVEKQPIQHHISPPPKKQYKKNVSRIKYQAIEINNKQYKSITQAAKDLNMTFGKLHNKIKNNKIEYKWLK
jgi:hypothetical protein